MYGPLTKQDREKAQNTGRKLIVEHFKLNIPLDKINAPMAKGFLQMHLAEWAFREDIDKNRSVEAFKFIGTLSRCKSNYMFWLNVRLVIDFFIKIKEMYPNQDREHKT